MFSSMTDFKETSVPDHELAMLADLYPHQYGKNGFGIRFEPLLPRTKQFDAMEIFARSESNRLLRLRLSPQKLSVKDIRNPYFHMFASISDGRIAQFELYTRLTDSTGVITPPHPDLFAKRFVSFNLAYFSLYAEPVQEIACIFEPFSLEYNRFHSAFADTGSLGDALMGTWSAQVYKEHGFEPNAATMSLVKMKDTDEPGIFVLFSK